MKPALQALLVVLLLSPAARAGGDPGTLTYALASDVDSLDPAWAYDATSLFVIQQVYEGLVGFDGESVDRFEPLAASIVPTTANGLLSANGLNYAFPIRAGVKFHDGTTMTPEDVKYSLLRFMLADRDGGPSSLLLEPLTGRSAVRGPDGKPDPAVFDLADEAVSVEGGAVVLRLKKPFAPLLSVLAGFAPVVSKSYIAAHGGWDGKRETWAAFCGGARETTALFAAEAGAGPFKLTGWNRELKRLTLARDDAYWREPAKLAGAVLLTVEDPKLRRRLLESGEADAAQVDPRALPFFQAVPGAVVDAGLPLLETDDVVFFNQKIDPRDNPWLGSGRLDGRGIPPDFFADTEVRRAFAFAFDYDAFIREGFHGAAERARGPIPRGLPGHAAANQRGLSYSLEESEKAFRGARGGEIWTNGFLLTVAYADGDAGRAIACRILGEGLAKVNANFRVDCRGIPQTTLLDELRARRLGAFVYRWILDYPDPHNAVEPFLHSTGFFASAQSYSNPRADAMIEQAAAETDPNQRKLDYGELQALALYDIPDLFTAEANGAFARRAGVRGWLHNPIQPYGSLYGVVKLP
jgi:peptide/nickel transport system substrate-binding protein